jgi:cytochrome c peroxidase
MSAAKVELGRHLFYDTRLSGNQTQSCASCHLQEFAFTDGLAVVGGLDRRAHPRNSMSLANVAYATTYTWANPVLLTLEQQMLVPLFGDDPVELGCAAWRTSSSSACASEPRYTELFAAAFPDDADPLTLTTSPARSPASNAACCPATPPTTATPAATRRAVRPARSAARRCSTSRALECFHCHAGFNFQDSVAYAGKPRAAASFTTPASTTSTARALPAGQHRPARVHRRRRRHGPIPRADPAQHRRHRPVHARRQRRHAVRGPRPLRRGRPHDRRRTRTPGVGRDNPFKSSFIRGFELTSAGAGRRARLPRQPDRRARS